MSGVRSRAAFRSSWNSVAEARFLPRSSRRRRAQTRLDAGPAPTTFKIRPRFIVLSLGPCSPTPPFFSIVVHRARVRRYRRPGCRSIEIVTGRPPGVGRTPVRPAIFSASRSARSRPGARRLARGGGRRRPDLDHGHASRRSHDAENIVAASAAPESSRTPAEADMSRRFRGAAFTCRKCPRNGCGRSWKRGDAGWTGAYDQAFTIRANSIPQNTSEPCRSMVRRLADRADDRRRRGAPPEDVAVSFTPLKIHALARAIVGASRSASQMMAVYWRRPQSIQGVVQRQLPGAAKTAPVVAFGAEPRWLRRSALVHFQRAQRQRELARPPTGRSRMSARP